jgi:hypothetical protein
MAVTCRVPCMEYVEKTCNRRAPGYDFTGNLVTLQAGTYCWVSEADCSDDSCIKKIPVLLVGTTQYDHVFLVLHPTNGLCYVNSQPRGEQ